MGVRVGPSDHHRMGRWVLDGLGASLEDSMPMALPGMLRAKWTGQLTPLPACFGVGLHCQARSGVGLECPRGFRHQHQSEHRQNTDTVTNTKYRMQPAAFLAISRDPAAMCIQLSQSTHIAHLHACPNPMQASPAWSPPLPG